MPEKSPQVLEYLKYRGAINSYAFVELLNQHPKVRVKPHDGQWEIINAFEQKIPAGAESQALGLEFEYAYNFIIAACGRRFGKSVIASVLGAQELLIPNAKVLICSFTLDNCEVIFKHIRSIVIGLGLKLKADRAKDMELELENGSTLRVASNDNVESKLGTAVSLLILDEAKLFSRHLFEQILLPMTSDFYPYSRTILISSPQAGWFESYYKFGQATDERYRKYWSINLPTSTNPAISKQFLAEKEATTPPDIFAQEYLGLFTSAAGLVAREFSLEANIFDPCEYPEFNNWLHDGNVIVNSIDSGYSHHFASIHFLYVEEIDTIFVFNEYQRNKTVTSVHADTIKEFEQENDLDITMRYADPAASQQIADLAEYGLYYNKADKQLKETVNCVNTWFFQEGVTGKKKLLISRDCVELLRQLTTVQWKEGRDDFQTKEQSASGTKPFKPDTDRRTDWDLFDAFRYGIYSFVKTSRVDLNVMECDAPDEDPEDPFYTMMREQGYFRVSPLLEE